MLLKTLFLFWSVWGSWQLGLLVWCKKDWRFIDCWWEITESHWWALWSTLAFSFWSRPYLNIWNEVKISITAFLSQNLLHISICQVHKKVRFEILQSRRCIPALDASGSNSKKCLPMKIWPISRVGGDLKRLRFLHMTCKICKVQTHEHQGPC